MSFYVYRLIDPRDSSAFYIGKGKGQRAWQHELDARSGRIGNKVKHNRIMAILGSALAVKVEIVANFTDERMAYAHEWDLIQNTLGLTNIIGSSAEGSEIPPTPDEIRRARVEAKRQQVLRKIESQYATFVKGQPAHLRQLAADWIADIRENSRESVTFWAASESTDALLGAVNPRKKSGRKLRRKYKRSNPAVRLLSDLPPRL